jgi:hypothetical protein
LLGVCSIAYVDQWEAVNGADTLQAMYTNTVMQGESWRAEYCADGSVAVVDVGAGKAIDTTNIKDPVVGFVFGQKGLMANLIFEGSKHTKLDKTNDRQNPIQKPRKSSEGFFRKTGTPISSYTSMRSHCR